jgi:cytochrome c-type protein NapC
VCLFKTLIFIISISYTCNEIKGGTSVEAEKKKTLMKGSMLLVVVGVIIGALLSFGTAVMVKHTDDAEFCGMCHTMQPMIDSYEADVHGGANTHGMKIACLECHLPHESLFGYLLAKAKTGTHDVWAELTYDKSKIDWEAKRKEAKHFVYDSACMNCHSNLQQSTMGDHRAFIAHKDYFEKRTDKKCVECHKNVGHHLLGNYLKQAKEKSLKKELEKTGGSNE